MVNLQARLHAHLHDRQIGPCELGLLSQGRAAGAKLRHRGAQVGQQMAEHEPGLRRIRFGEELHRRQRIEQEMGLDLRLHQLELRLGCLLREQIAVGFGSEYLGPRACLAKLEQEQ